MNIFVVIPAYNEQSTIKKVVEELRTLYKNIIIVDDASTDKTSTVLKDLEVVVLTHLINRGQGAALKTGITYALEKSADIIVTFDADGQHSAESVKKLIQPILEGSYDVVLGSRFLNNDNAKNIPSYRKNILKLALLFTRFTSKLKITDTHNGLRAFSRSAAKKIRIKQDRMAHASEIPDEIFKHNLSYIEVPVVVKYTEYSISKVGENHSPFAFAKIIFKYFIGKLMR